MLKAIIGILLILVAGQTLADDCVVGTEIINLRPDGAKAVSSVLSVEIYSDIRSCNDALAYKARYLPLTAAAKAYPWDSLTFDCHIPGSCHPIDEGSVEPFSRVVYVKRGKGRSEPKS